MKSYKITKKTTKLVIGLSLICLLVAVVSTKYYLNADDLDVDIQPSNIRSIGTIIDRVLEFLEYTVASIAFLNLIIAGIQYITAGGDAEKAKKAQKSILYCVIGIMLAILSYAITKSIFQVLNGRDLPPTYQMLKNSETEE